MVGECHVRYLINPAKLTQFEHYARRWIPLVQRFGGQHHGYFLPSEGINNVALPLNLSVRYLMRKYVMHR